jgi:hypothetical protein
VYPIGSANVGKNNYFWATRACAQQGGYLPSAAQLIGAADRVKLESVITDSPQYATVDQDPSHGLKDRREMSATLVTTAAGSSAAGSEGVSEGATGDPRNAPAGEPEPGDTPVRDGLRQLQDGRLRRLGVSIGTRELPLRVQQDARSFSRCTPIDREPKRSRRVRRRALCLNRVLCCVVWVAAAYRAANTS